MTQPFKLRYLGSFIASSGNRSEKTFNPLSVKVWAIALSLTPK
jgi:hypothetical protein